jgi:hypothetical protein
MNKLLFESLEKRGYMCGVHCCPPPNPSWCCAPPVCESAPQSDGTDPCSDPCSAPCSDPCAGKQTLKVDPKGDPSCSDPCSDPCSGQLTWSADPKSCQISDPHQNAWCEIKCCQDPCGHQFCSQPVAEE